MSKLLLYSLHIGCLLWMMQLIHSAEIEDFMKVNGAGLCSLKDELKFFAVKNSCQDYYGCYKGEAYIFRCPKAMSWNQITQRCDLAENGRCDEITVPNPPSVPSYPGTPSQYYLPHPTDCSSYYQCSSLRCPNGFSWNALSQRCDIGQSSRCPSKQYNLETKNIVTIPKTAASRAIADETKEYQLEGDPELNELCKKGKSETIVHPNNCEKYIVCSNIAYVMPCPPGLFWNSELNVCDRQCI